MSGSCSLIFHFDNPIMGWSLLTSYYTAKLKILFQIRVSERKTIQNQYKINYTINAKSVSLWRGRIKSYRLRTVFCFSTFDILTKKTVNQGWECIILSEPSKENTMHAATIQIKEVVDILFEILAIVFFFFCLDG